MKILVCNSGSSSLKFSLFEVFVYPYILLSTRINIHIKKTISQLFVSNAPQH